MRRKRDKCAASEWDIARQWHLFVSRERPIYQAPSCHFRLYYSCAKFAIYTDLHHPPSSYHRGFVIIHDEFQPGQKTTTNSTSFKFCTPRGVDQTGCMEVGTSERIYLATNTHTRQHSHLHRPSEETSSEKTLIPSSTLSPHTTLQSSVSPPPLSSFHLNHHPFPDPPPRFFTHLFY